MTHDVRGKGAGEAATFRYERSPVDVLHLVVFGVLVLLLGLLSRYATKSLVGFEEDIVSALDFITPTVERVLAGVAQALLLVGVLATWLVPVFTKRYRLFGYVVVANVLAASLGRLAKWLVDRDDSLDVVNKIAAKAGISDTLLRETYPVAQFTAALVVFAPFLSRSWRRAGFVLLSLIVVLRILVAVHLPSELFVMLPLGAMVGAAVLFAFGRPDRRPTLDAIRAALVGAGVPVSEVHAAKVDARGSTPYFATLDDGSGLFAKVLGSDQRAADLLFRVYRAIRLKNVGDERPFSSLRRTVEHEALVALFARDVGVPTPRLRAVADVGEDSMLLAYDMIKGSSLDGVPDEQVTDEVMRGVWEEIALLRRHKVAHRDLRRANVFIGDDGKPYIIDFGFSELAASDALLSADVAQMLASFAVVAEPERVVRVAIEAIGRDAVAASLPRIQMPALSGATQSALKAQKGRLKELQEAVQQQCAVDEVQLEPLQRVNGKTIFIIVVLAAATYFIIPQLADLPGIFGEIKDADWKWLPLALLLSALTYVGATFSLGGAVPDPLPGNLLFATQVGSSFASKIAPAGLGGMALNARFLQKQGVDEPVAVTAVGLNTLAGFVGHLSLIGIFMVWAGSKAFKAFHLPDPTYFLIGLGVVALLTIIFMSIPSTRKMVLGKVVPILKRALKGVTTVARRPAKMASLLGGSIFVTLSYLVTLFVCLQAFGGGLGFATTGAVYLVGAAVATAAPTPGGLGAVEAALIAGLTGAGLDSQIAVPTVFLYRLCTFWAPILPGWGCFTFLQRREYI